MIKDDVLKALRDAGVTCSERDLEIPKKEEFGDLAFACFQLAREKRVDPHNLALDISRKIQVSKYPSILKIEVRGGYVNFFLYWEKIAESLLKGLYEKKKIKTDKVMVEFSQPNPVHPMHIGHARSTFLGDCVSNLLSYAGCRVIRANYMNDLGLQVAKLITAYTLWGKGKRPTGKPDLWLWKYYVKFHENASADPSLEEKARDVLRKIELGKDKRTIMLWKKLVSWCVKGFKETYKNLGINFDVWFYESDFREKGKHLVDKALVSGIAVKTPENTVVTNLKDYGLPDTVLLRSDGTGLYITSDLGLTVHKFENYNLDSAIWVVMSHQNLYFKQLFKVLELLGYKWYSKCIHLSYEPVTLAEGKMSSREGRAVMLDEVLKELTKLAYEEVNKRNPKERRSRKMRIARDVAIGALKYAILRVEPEDVIVFDWKQMLSLEGNTGPYIQYTVTRCSSILRKAGKWKKVFRVQKLDEVEKMLVKALSAFDNVIQNAINEMRVYSICNYVYELAKTFNLFYERCPVLRSEGENRNFRLTLVDATMNVLKTCLKIIGVKPLKKM